MVYYRHHIIPLHEWRQKINLNATRHDRDYNAPDNWVWLTLEQHIQAHKLLYELNRNEFDKVAYQGMSGIIGNEEVHRLVGILSNIGNQHAKGNKHTDEWKQNNSERMKFLWANRDRKERHRTLMAGNRYTLGRKRPAEERIRIRLALLGKPGHRSTPEQSMAQSIRQVGKKRGPYRTKNT